jgi:hypothetical protein
MRISMAKKPDTRTQAEKFRDAAREAGTELDQHALDRAIGSVGKTARKTEAEARKEEGKPPR